MDLENGRYHKKAQFFVGVVCGISKIALVLYFIMKGAVIIIDRIVKITT